MRFQPTSPRIGAALIAALFVAFAAGTPAFGQATTTTTNETIPFTSTLLNPCTGDLVTFQGNMHVTQHFTTDSGGGTHLKTHVNYQDVSGTGAPSGLNYTVRTTTNTMENDSDGPQSEVTMISTVKLISQGSALNYFLRLVFHVTVNANGQTTSTVDEAKVECRGNS
ncbi:MAG TPA: hypothetical protein VD861_04145 [Pyrinomonadaceae bacterium]|nr:hypothetical protein [Pyrinomonadaceae bacterium]